MPYWLSLLADLMARDGQHRRRRGHPRRRPRRRAGPRRRLVDPRGDADARRVRRGGPREWSGCVPRREWPQNTAAWRCSPGAWGTSTRAASRPERSACAGHRSMTSEGWRWLDEMDFVVPARWRTFVRYCIPGASSGITWPACSDGRSSTASCPPAGYAPEERRRSVLGRRPAPEPRRGHELDKGEQRATAHGHFPTEQTAPERPTWSPDHSPPAWEGARGGRCGRSRCSTCADLAGGDAGGHHPPLLSGCA